mmetsp:Transcript_7233/g.17676  ORF Transcript_7233/g.17676 Transcript_7233/m.17676 type:complete len:763 (+) Transcript_7233:176-2464(+)
MEEHDDASLMLGEDDSHHHHHDPGHHHEENEEHDMHDDEDEDEEHMDIEPNRIEGVSATSSAPLEQDEFWDVEPTKEQIWEMKKANKRPSEWLKLLCKDWAEAEENLELIETVDDKFESYKPYLKGKLSSQLLCRLCIPSDLGSSKDGSSKDTTSNNNNSKTNFLRNVLNIQDEFDKAYVIAQVERFCALYDVRGIQQHAEAHSAAASGSTSGGSGTTGSTNGVSNRFTLPNNEATAAAAAALYGDLVVNAALGSVSDVHQQAIAAAAAATASAAGQQQTGGISIPPHFLTADATAAAVAAAQQAQAQAAQQSQVVAGTGDSHKSRSDTSSSSSGNQQVFVSRSAQALLTKAQQQAKSAERALEQERKQNAKREQRRLSQDKKLAKQRDREFLQKQKQAEKMAREKAREEKRTRKLLQRQQRELFAQEQKEAALRRAAELVASNRVPIEITRAGTFRSRGKPKPTPPVVATKILIPNEPPKEPVVAAAAAVEGPKKRQRSAIVVSTASDLDRIVTHSQNLWAKYNAIAKEHNQRVNWITVAKELGIHVKVREKYARMHSRACQRNFDFVANGHWKIKDHPEIFQEPTAAEQKARMPPPLPPSIDSTTTVVIEEAEAKENTPTANGQEDISGEPQQDVPPQEGGQVKHESNIVSDTNDSIPPPMGVSAPSTSESSGSQQHHHLGIDAAAAAATAAAVVDAAGVGGATIDMHHVVELTTATEATATVEESGSGETTGSDIPHDESNNNGEGNGSAEDEVVAFEL